MYGSQYSKESNSSWKDNESDSDSELEDDSFSKSYKDTSLTRDKRISRNKNEKNRRDQFNGLIQELGKLISSKRKIDKASVLNEAIIYFENNQSKLSFIIL